ncbi:WhiB family transcriptional regulator [Streptomyces erythrochromogenes]|uniref:WhiB family transcriptional regulator n=1 Tax=Streptomyces erythrochromogenes TaxID=285574 RepID=UPI003439380E
MSTLVSNPRSRPHADTEPAAHWAELARCLNRRADFEASEVRARAMCAACPVKIQCLDEALQEEGTSAPGYRSEIRGGRTPLERAVLAGYVRPAAAPSGRIAGDMDKAEQLLRAGRSDREVSDATGVGRRSVSKLRNKLGVPPIVDHRGATPAERLAERTRPGPDGHQLWHGSEHTHIAGHKIRGIRLAFEVGHGRPAVGAVKRLCGTELCVAWQHLADRPMRDALAARSGAHAVPAGARP